MRLAQGYDPVVAERADLLIEASRTLHDCDDWTLTDGDCAACRLRDENPPDDFRVRYMHRYEESAYLLAEDHNIGDLHSAYYYARRKSPRQ